MSGGLRVYWFGFVVTCVDLSVILGLCFGVRLFRVCLFIVCGFLALFCVWRCLFVL